MPGPRTGANCGSRCQALSAKHFNAVDDVFWLFSDVSDPFCAVTANCSRRSVCEVGFARVLGCSGQEPRAQPLPTEKKINKKLPNLGLAFNYVIPLAGEQAPPLEKGHGENRHLQGVPLRIRLHGLLPNTMDSIHAANKNGRKTPARETIAVRRVSTNRNGEREAPR